MKQINLLGFKCGNLEIFAKFKAAKTCVVGMAWTFSECVYNNLTSEQFDGPGVVFLIKEIRRATVVVRKLCVDCEN